MSTANIDLIGSFPETLRSGAEQIEGVMVNMINDARSEEFEEDAIPNPREIRLGPMIMDTEIVFLVGSHHETSGPAVEFPALLQNHEFSFKLKMEGDDLIAFTERDKEYTLTTREALYLAQLLQAASLQPDHRPVVNGFRSLDPVDGSWLSWMPSPPV